ncbi:MAG: TonB-dependent receptor [Pseudomonadota bacterium]
MQTRYLKRPLCGALMLASTVTLMPISLPSFAQGLEEVIVTAQRREESLQDVPMSISAFTGDDLNVRLIDDLTDLQFSVPNLVSDGLTIMIRGIGQNTNSSTAEGGIGYHVNEVYVNKPLIRSTEYFDIERVEVLRGPQGTLYGRNTTAGVINIHTKRPHEELGGNVSVLAGDYETLRLKGAFNIPVTDKLRQRFAGLYLTRDGYNKNIYTGNRIDGRDSYQLRSSTSYDFTDSLTADLVISYLKEDSDRADRTKGTCTKDPEYGCSPLSVGFSTPDVSGSIFQTLNNAFLQGTVLPQGDYFADAVNPADYRRVNVDQEPTFEAEQFGVSLEFNYEYGEYRFTSLTGYYDTETDIFSDFDRFATDVRLLQPVTYRANGEDFVTTDLIQSGRRDLGDADQFTQEFRIASDYDGWFNFLLGAFYYDEESSATVLITHPTLAATQQVRGLPEEFEMFTTESDPVKTESYALFGETYFNLNEQTKLTLGLRYTDDKKSIRTRQLFLELVDPEWVEAERDWQELTGKVTLDYVINDSSIVYATVARGYKAGGLNPGGPEGGEDFDPEFLWAYEAGSKNTFFDGLLQANASIFFYDYEGMQLAQVSETSSVTTNADNTSMGLEAEFSFAPTNEWFFDLNLAWLDLEIDDFTSADQGDPDGIAPGTVPARDAEGNIRYTSDGLLIKNLDGNVLRNAPEYSVNVGAQYTYDLDSGYALSGRVDYTWQDGYFANEFNKPSDELGSWQQIDAQIVLNPPSAQWQLRAFVKNALDDDDLLRLDQQGPTVGRFRSATVLEPRTYGVEFSIYFE